MVHTVLICHSRRVTCVIVRPATVNYGLRGPCPAIVPRLFAKVLCSTGPAADPVGSIDRARTGLIMRMTSYVPPQVAAAAASSGEL